MGEILFIAVVAFSLILLLVFIPVGYHRIVREFLNIWVCQPIELTVLSSSVKPCKFGYLIEIKHEFSHNGERIESQEVGASVGKYCPFRKLAESEAKQFKVGESYKGYFDPRSKRTFLEERHYDLTDRIFSPLFLIGLPLMWLAIFAGLIFGLKSLL